MKRFILNIFLVSILLSFIGCGESSQDASSSTKPVEKVAKPENSVPEFKGDYIQTKNNDFIELKIHKEVAWFENGKKVIWGYGTKCVTAKDRDNFIINKIPIEDFKYFISRGWNNHMSVEIGEEQYSDGDYSICPTGNLDGKSAVNGNIIKIKVNVNTNEIYYVYTGYGNILVKFY